MDFNNIDELKKRIEPALKSKSHEFRKEGYNITEEDIWQYLSQNVFRNSHNLTLYDIVKEIMHIDKEKLIK